MSGMSARPVLAVLGGSFNPPHLGHAMLPGHLLARTDVQRVLVAPCAYHPLGKGLAPFDRRMFWVRQAMSRYGERVEVSDIEAELAAHNDGRPSYAITLLDAVAAREPGSRIRLVIGSDLAGSDGAPRWRHWDRIRELYDPLVVPRPGWCASNASTLPEISSTQARSVFAEIRRTSLDGRDALHRLTSLVPRAVAEDLLHWAALDESSMWQ